MPRAGSVDEAPAGARELGRSHCARCSPAVACAKSVRMELLYRRRHSDQWQSSHMKLRTHSPHHRPCPLPIEVLASAFYASPPNPWPFESPHQYQDRRPSPHCPSRRPPVYRCPLRQSLGPFHQFLNPAPFGQQSYSSLNVGSLWILRISWRSAWRTPGPSTRSCLSHHWGTSPPWHHSCCCILPPTSSNHRRRLLHDPLSVQYMMNHPARQKPPIASQLQSTESAKPMQGEWCASV
mmetsp:Transcript_21974/g.27074  ORF Transcript_21974/g.27074 Transcript_21974/m.27074 type:complete len:237 (+) Transcript_21974:196-906(+)